LPPRAIEAYSLWAEQLIAESTGKEGRASSRSVMNPRRAGGLTPTNRPLSSRSASAMTPEFEPLNRGAEGRRTSGHHVSTSPTGTTSPLEFFRWEFATAVAGAHLTIDPFDEPNVKESKDNTQAVLQQYEQSGSLPDEAAAVTDGALRVYGDVSGSSASGALAAHLDTAKPRRLRRADGLRDPRREQPSGAATSARRHPRLAQARDHARVRSAVPAQHRPVHKGGPNTGVYIQITADDGTDVTIPGAPYTFSILKRAQAAGDLQSLRNHGRRVVRVHIAGNLDAGLASLTDAVSATTAAR